MKMSKYITAKAAFFIISVITSTIALYFINTKYEIQWKDIFVEANGMVFDLILLGILLTFFEVWREKKDKIERLHEEIDDYRGWDEKEATYRIVGALRRLKKLGVLDIDLSNCFLQGARLGGVNLQGVNLYRANLQDANLSDANLKELNLMATNLQGANLYGADLRNAKLVEANLQGAKLYRANLQGANFTVANLQGAMLEGAKLQGVRLDAANLKEINFQGVNLQGVNLHHAIVDKDWFEKLELWKIEGIEEIKEKYEITLIKEGKGEVWLEQKST
jgi:BTB/POZ domain-containing protein KCTD9